MAMVLTNSIFIRTPKTGSTFCKDVITKMGLFEQNIGHNHDKWENLNQNELFASKPFKFCFVRDPVDWYKSYWAHRMNNIWRPDIRTDVNFLDLYCKDDSFEQFILNIYDRYPNGFIGDLFERYKRGCTFVGRFENLRHDLISALTLAGEKIDKSLITIFPKKNVSNPIYKAVKVSPNIKNMIYDKEAR